MRLWLFFAVVFPCSSLLAQTPPPTPAPTEDARLCAARRELYTPDAQPLAPAARVLKTISACERSCAAGVPSDCTVAALLAAVKPIEDAPRAVRVATIACEKGDAAGCDMLGDMFEEGPGVVHDLSRAATLYVRACTLNPAAGCYNAARFFLHGWSVARDERRAVELLDRGCHGGEVESCSRLAGYYVYGDDIVPRNLPLGTKLAEWSCQRDGLWGCTTLAEVADSARRYDEAAVLWRKSCDGGELNACAALSSAYEEGRGVLRDQARAVELAQKGCTPLYGRGCVNLGGYYEAGNGLPRDPARAIAAYRQGCEADNGTACHHAAWFYYVGSAVPFDPWEGGLYLLRACEEGDSECAIPAPDDARTRLQRSSH